MNKKDELLRADEERWDLMCSLLDRVPDWDKPGVAGEWSAKDLLGHVAAWHAVTMDRLEQYRMKGELPAAPADIDEFNARTCAENQDLSLHDVKVIAGASRHRFREELAQLKEDDAAKLEPVITANAHGHYEEHIVQLQDYLAKENA
jgi:hypothetical protein